MNLGKWGQSSTSSAIRPIIAAAVYQNPNDLQKQRDAKKKV